MIMKKLLLAVGMFPVATFGQIVLTNTHFPVAGDQLVLSTATDPALDYLSTGANYTWDFSGLTASGQRFTDCRPMSEASSLSNLLFGALAATPYKASYFGPTTDLPLDQLTSVLPVTIDEISQFSKSNSTALTLVGFEFVISGQGVPAKSDTIETRYAFPLEYGDSYSSHGYTDLDMNPIYDAKWIQHRYRESEVDGWGTITTPYGTFNALRIHHRIQESDSIYLSIDTLGTWIPIPVPEAHEYEWRAMEEKEAILRVKTSVILGTETITAIEYRDEYNGLSVEESAMDFNYFPNPAMDELHIVASEVIDEVVVRNQQGQQVVGLNGTTSVITAEVGDLPAGVYYLEVKTTGGTKVRLFVKQ